MKTQTKIYNLDSFSYLLKEWLIDAIKGNQYSVFSNLPQNTRDLIYKTQKEKYFLYKEMVTLKKALQKRYKDIDKYGGVPSKIEKERNLLNEIIENIKYELKHSEIKKG